MKEIMVIDGIDVRKVTFTEKGDIDIELQESKHLVVSSYAMNYINSCIDKLVKQQVEITIEEI
jgi:hypothetical protein